MTMTTATEPKKHPDFHVFVKDENGDSQRVGAVFLHGKGKGFNILIGKRTYSAFARKDKEEGSAA